jgi:PEGA domain-containing protein
MIEELSIGEFPMKQYLSILLVCCILAPSSFAGDTTTSATPAAPVAAANLSVKHSPDGNPILEDGTPIRLRLTRALSSADCTTGDRIDFEVMDPIVLDGVTVVPQGGIAWGTVTDAEHKKSMGRAGKLDLALVAVKLSNADKANLRAVKETKGGGHTGAMAGAMVATAIVFWPAAPLFLFVHGKDTKIPQGTEITAYVDGDKVFVPLPESASAAADSSQPTVASTELTLVSTPDGAEIELDGAFVGNTPSTVTLASGDHTVRVSKKGYQPYEKNLRTAGGKINLRAELDAAAQ